MNDLEDFFFNKNHRLMHKWRHYFEIYDTHLHHLRDQHVNILEIGIAHGGSLQMWDYYFKGNATIYAIDINPECKKFESDNVKIFIGSQDDKAFLQKVRDSIPKIDILIDDGGHRMKQQIITFETLFNHITENGIYICEDMHTSYWKTYGGGYRKKRSFVEYAKKLIDLLNAWHIKNMKPTDFTTSSHSMHFYDSVLVIEKRPMSSPFDVKSGEPAIKDEHENQLLVNRQNDTV